MPADVDKVFKALADASRRQLLDRLHADNGRTLGELCAGLDMTRQAVTKHLAALEAANLVVTVWRAREKLNPVPIGEIAERWIGKLRARPRARARRTPSPRTSTRAAIPNGRRASRSSCSRWARPSS